MSESVTAEPEPVDHQHLVDWVAVCRSHGGSRHLHRIEGDPDELESGDVVEVACDTTLIGKETVWRAKPAAAFPPGYLSLCSHEECFGDQ